jgi:hypothetical protein
MSTNPTLSDVRERRAKIASEIARLDALKQEDQELEIAERVLARMAGQSAPEPRNPPLVMSFAAGAGRTRKIADLVIDYLGASRELWLTANEIRDGLSAIRGAEIPMSTISPTLSNLKANGIVSRDGLKVALTERLDARTRNEIEMREVVEVRPGFDEGDTDHAQASVMD